VQPALSARGVRLLWRLTCVRLRLHVHLGGCCGQVIDTKKLLLAKQERVIALMCALSSTAFSTYCAGSQLAFVHQGPELSLLIPVVRLIDSRQGKNSVQRVTAACY
jgi:hypothetical protein